MSPSESTVPEVIDATGVEIEPIDGRMLLGVPDPVDQLEAAERFATALKAKIEQNHLSHRIAGNEYLGIDALQMAATALGIVGIVTSTQKLENGYAATAEARTLDGRLVGRGESQCNRGESSWSRRPDYAVQGMAETRALARAFRGPVGSVISLASFASTPAEEMTSSESEPAPLPGWAKPCTNDEVSRLAATMTAIFDASGVAKPGEATITVGKRVRARCDGTIPVCIVRVLEDLVTTALEGAKPAASSEAAAPAAS
jgi:hypothetical protein